MCHAPVLLAIIFRLLKVASNRKKKAMLEVNLYLCICRSSLIYHISLLLEYMQYVSTFSNIVLYDKPVYCSLYILLSVQFCFKCIKTCQGFPLCILLIHIFK
ncbi:hypothetical protein ACF0H5_002998 [Mactra antiquata]